MSESLGHPLVVALIGAAVAGALVQHIAQRWQERQKAFDVRVGLVADMSEVSMGLMAHFEAVLALEELADEAGARAALDVVDARRQEFAARKAVVGTKLEAYLASPAMAERWGHVGRGHDRVRRAQAVRCRP
jgi:cytochrome c556